jgi:hypothetical protein
MTGFMAHMGDDDIGGYLIYPEGDLDIAYFHDYEAQYFRKTELVRTQCVPRATKFPATATSKVTMTVTHQDRTKTEKGLKPDAIVWLTNEPPEGHQPPTDELEEHFTEYVGVMKRRNLATTRQFAIVEPATKKCAAGPTLPNPLPMLSGSIFPDTQGFTISANPACANTDWP